MSDLTKADLRERLGNIDQIRDILFGSQLRDFDMRLGQVEKGLSGLQQDLRSRTDEVRQALSSELQTAADSIEKKLRSSGLKDEEEKFEIHQQLDNLSKRIASSTDEAQQKLTGEIKEATDDLARQLKLLGQREEEEKSSLRQQIDLASKRLHSNTENLNETIEAQNTSLRADLLETREKLQEAVLALKNQLYKELGRSVTQLTRAKVARDDMAELLFELGLRLKGTEFLPELSKAGSQEGATEPDALPSE